MAISGDLYNEVILSHNKNACHFVKKPDAEVVLRANNPICGDRFDLFIDWEPNNSLKLHFHGFGCALSKASTSILAEMIHGKTHDEALLLCTDLLSFITGESQTDRSEFNAFKAVHNHFGRLECVKLSWAKLKEHLEENHKY